MLLSSNCFSMSPGDQFLDFINKNRTDIAMLRTKLQEKAQDTSCSFKNITEAFLVKYGDCFDAKVVADTSTDYSASIFYSAAQLIGIGYLEAGMKKAQLTSLESALAWFRSIPSSFQQMKLLLTASDLCISDYKRMSETELKRITKQNERLERLRQQSSGVF